MTIRRTLLLYGTYGVVLLGLIFIVTPLFFAITGVKLNYLGMPNFDIMAYISMVIIGIILAWWGFKDLKQLEKQQKVGKTVENREKIEKPAEEKKTSQDNDAVKALKLRYAKGEINKEEYEQMKKKLEG